MATCDSMILQNKFFKIWESFTKIGADAEPLGLGRSPFIFRKISTFFPFHIKITTLTNVSFKYIIDSEVTSPSRDVKNPRNQNVDTKMYKKLGIKK